MGRLSCVLAVLVVVLVIAAAALLSAGPRAANALHVLGGGARATKRTPSASKPHPRLRAKSGATAANIAWESELCWPEPLAAACLRAARASPARAKDGGFGPAGPDEAAALSAEARRLSAQYGVAVRPEALLAMRDMEVALAARRCGARALRLGPEMAAEHAAGASVLSLAARHRVAPLAVLKQLLAEAGHGPAQIRALLASPAGLPARLAAEAPAVFAADLGSRLNAEKTQAASQAYESAVGAHLRHLGLEFETEADLRRAGPPGAPTPDFLLRSGAAINGHPVRWLDAKNYALYGSQLVAKSLVQQAQKYAEAFGPGAMVFSGGVACGAARALAAAPALAGRAPLLLDGSRIA